MIFPLERNKKYTIVMSLGTLFGILNLEIEGVTAMNINLDKCTNLYEIKTHFHIDPSNSKPYRVQIETIFHDESFLSHIKDAYGPWNFDYIRINLIDFYPFPAVTITNYYTELCDSRVKFIETLQDGGVEIGTVNKKTALRFLDKVEKKLRKHFSQLEKRYLEARQAATATI
jgi:hypothetical protein